MVIFACRCISIISLHQPCHHPEVPHMARQQKTAVWPWQGGGQEKLQLQQRGTTLPSPTTLSTSPHLAPNTSRPENPPTDSVLPLKIFAQMQNEILVNSVQDLPLLIAA